MPDNSVEVTGSEGEGKGAAIAGTASGLKFFIQLYNYESLLNAK